MARQRLAELINPAACNDPQTAQLARSIFAALQLIDNVLNIQVDDENQYEYNLENLTSVDVSEINADQINSEYIDVWNELVSNEITAVNIDTTNIDVTNNTTMVNVTMTTVDITNLDVEILNAYSITYIVLYDDGTHVCPSACGSPPPVGCANCTDVDALPATVFLDVTWPTPGSPTTINLSRTSQVLSSAGSGYCEAKYAGSGAFGTGSTAQFKVWIRRSCAGVDAPEMRYIHDHCSGSFDVADDNIFLWEPFTTSAVGPLTASRDETAIPLSYCGEDISNALIELYE